MKLNCEPLPCLPIDLVVVLDVCVFQDSVRNKLGGGKINLIGDTAYHLFLNSLHPPYSIVEFWANIAPWGTASLILTLLLCCPVLKSHPLRPIRAVGSCRFVSHSSQSSVMHNARTELTWLCLCSAPIPKH